MADFDTGTKTLFQQTNAPTGWTKDTTYNDYTIRIVSGNASTGGTVAFSTVHASKTWQGTVSGVSATDNFALTTNEIPGHTHSYNLYGGAGILGAPGPGSQPARNGSPTASNNTGSTGAGAGHAHPVTFTFTGDSKSLAISYVDIIIASKN